MWIVYNFKKQLELCYWLFQFNLAIDPADKTSAGFQQQTTKLVYGSTYTVNVTSDFERQQFHKVVQDPTGT